MCDNCSGIGSQLLRETADMKNAMSQGPQGFEIIGNSLSF